MVYVNVMVRLFTVDYSGLIGIAYVCCGSTLSCLLDYVPMMMLMAALPLVYVFNIPPYGNGWILRSTIVCTIP
jgi:hypothetical protein